MRGTCDALARAAEPDPDEQAQCDEIRRRIAALDVELDSYRSIVRDEPADKAAVYTEMGITITYNYEGRALIESPAACS